MPGRFDLNVGSYKIPGLSIIIIILTLNIIILLIEVKNKYKLKLILLILNSMLIVSYSILKNLNFAFSYTVDLKFYLMFVISIILTFICTLCILIKTKISATMGEPVQEYEDIDNV